MNPQKEWVPKASAPSEKSMNEISHNKYGPPSAIWAYRNADGTIHHYILRFDTPNEKAYSPFTYGTFDGKQDWYFRGPGKGRPFYNEQELRDRPDAPVVLSEGEKAADAGKKLLPNYVVITTSGGANAPQNTNFGLLCGREVVIWPDNDDGGTRYKDAVVKLLQKAGASKISVVTLPKGLPEKFDLADQWPAELGSPEYERHLEMAQVIYDFGAGNDSSSTSNAPFKRTSTGVFYLKGNEEIKISEPLDVIAMARSSEHSNWAYLVQFCDHDSHEHRLLIKAEDLSSDGVVRRILENLGLRMHHQRQIKEKITEYIGATTAGKRVFLSKRCGWHLVDSTLIFLMPDKFFGKSEMALYPNWTGHPYTNAGSLNDWRSQVSSLLAGNSRLMLAITASFVGPLLYPLNLESGGINFFGSSSSGKTTCLQVAASCWGKHSKFIDQWRVTDSGLEAKAARHCDTFLCLDELGVADPDVLGRLVYMLSNNRGKARALSDGSAAESAEWRAMFLSTAEMAMADKIKEGKSKRSPAGKVVRAIDIPIDAGAGMGAFEDIHDFESPKQFAEHLKEMTNQYYGTASLEFIRRIIEIPWGELNDRYRNELKSVLSKFPDDSHAQTQRILNRFAVAGLAGELAIEFEIVNWPKGTARSAILKCAKDWFDTRQKTNESVDTIDGVSKLKTFMQTHAESGFLQLSVTDGLEPDGFPHRGITYGYRETEAAGGMFYILPSVMKEILTGFTVKEVIHYLGKCGHLKEGEVGHTQLKKRLPGYLNPLRVYAIKQSFFSEDEVSHEA